MDWNTFALPLFATALAALIAVLWTVLIVFGYADQVPPPFQELLPTLVIGGILGAALKQGQGSK